MARLLLSGGTASQTVLHTYLLEGGIAQDQMSRVLTNQPAPKPQSAEPTGPCTRGRRHLGTLGMGLPPNESLVEYLEEILTTTEAEICLLLPTRVAPLEVVSMDEIVASANAPREGLAAALEDMVDRRLALRAPPRAGDAATRC